ncbi:thiamine pyrophosphate-binding protein [Solirubrobacter ginsenosidimutans]|uniref:Thiamine pyrophosphate-binding protein n=1 Tax=Solirubrobacter ginsenosidimutans TaxID=490573 RepID=A0A9X3S2V2_9ACTN|nr:thiamine pyrophosphate-binding protein [Solirubrobacter ginsenosidimutans]MDA0162692.1 thiamine pyrophosphate-binding protein [Solirubrobacter ginsenosidimutans]
MTVAELIAARLAAGGVSRAFGFPGGGSNLDLIEAFSSVGIEFVLSHTEVSAALMACATAELSGVPGVVVVGNGPGLTSVVNGVAHAHLDRVPLIVLSDRYTDAELTTTGHQILDQRALLAPVVKWSATVGARGVGALLDHALAVASAAPCGAVHLDMPRTVGGEVAVAAPPHDADLAATPHGADPAAPLGAPPGADLAAPLGDGCAAPPVHSAPPRGADPAAPPAASPHGADLAAIADALSPARHPVLLAGLEASRALSDGALQELAERLGAPVLTTYKAKGVLDERHPLWAGILTGGALEAPLLDAADAILTVGLDPVELLTKSWPHSAPVFALRTCALGADYGAPAVTWIGDLATGVAELTERLPGSRQWGDAGAHREQALSALRIESDSALTGWRVIEALVHELPADTPVAVDAGAHMFPATWFWRAHAPRRFLISNGLATMGFAVPSAIAAARDGLAVAITGDGGMAYGAFELETAVRLGARVLVVVLDDASLSLIRIKHEAKGHDRARLDFGPVGFATVAEGLGVASWVVEEEAALRLAIREAAASEGPALIDARISGAEYARTLEVVRG